ncbi:MAG: Asp-tRNA(Asn)/Glu-tRNA(Gln) amidotransferase subunit GatC [Proteobacteria bacterium]|nr:Asp-tRNA(Asn)/Glu-tRNA(Gln) amidotransferase subunit GatC [Pseudomonadota bacterium]
MIDKKTVEHVAKIARLSLSEDEKEKFAKELSAVVDSFAKIKEADTEGVEPTFQPVPISNVMRDDSEEKCLSQEEALANAEHKESGYFKGPRIV